MAGRGFRRPQQFAHLRQSTGVARRASKGRPWNRQRSSESERFPYQQRCPLQKNAARREVAGSLFGWANRIKSLSVYPTTGGGIMARLSKKLIVLLGVVVLMAALASSSPAQTVLVAPAPRVAYYSPPVVSYYAAPVCYTPAPAVSYYSPPAVSYYSPPAVSYYSPPAVSYYAPPAVSYYSPPAVVAAPATTVSTYRGILPWRTYTTATYGAAPLVTAP